MNAPENKSVPFKLADDDPVTRWRKETFYTKEPETVCWLDQMDPAALFLDVGANIGVYSLYAASRGLRVVALEPESQNFAALNRNIFANSFQDRMVAFPIALTCEGNSILASLYLSQFLTGGSCHSAGVARDWKGDKFAPVFEQGCMMLSYKQFLAFLAFAPTDEPEHIKIDVDGNEPDVIAGLDLKRRKHLVSLCIEINTNRADHRAMIADIVEAGFRFDGEQVARAMRPEGSAFEGCAEFIFVRA